MNRLRVPLFLRKSANFGFAKISLLSLLLIFAVITIPSPAHASNPFFVISTSKTQCTGACSSTAVVGVNTGDFIMVNHYCAGGTPGSISVSDNFADSYSTVLADPAGMATGAVFAAVSVSGGSLSVTITQTCTSVNGAAGQFSVEIFRSAVRIGVSSVGNPVSASNTISDTQSITVGTGSIVYEAFDVAYSTGNASCPSYTNGSGQTTSQNIACFAESNSGTTSGRSVYEGNLPAGLTSFTMSATGSNNGLNNVADHFVVELTATGTGGNPFSPVTFCYGNCGSPAVTLANTNSTHTINFNQSITLFYIVQSNLNGFVANVTAQVAKTYSNGQGIALGLYTVDPVCTASSPPFTPSCPGFLTQQSGIFFNPVKGKFFMTSSVTIKNGQWFGLAVTGAFQGLDLNDTNTNVVLSQASGQIPTVISQYTSLGNSKAAVYAFITGNSIIGGPSGSQIPPGCQTVTCGILALWAALGGDVAAGIGGFLIVLGLIVGFLLYITRQHNPDGSLKGFAIPMEMLGIVAVVVLIMFSAAGAIPAWIPGVIIFLVAGYFVAGVWGRRHHSNTVAG